MKWNLELGTNREFILVTRNTSQWCETLDQSLYTWQQTTEETQIFIIIARTLSQHFAQIWRMKGWVVDTEQKYWFLKFIDFIISSRQRLYGNKLIVLPKLGIDRLWLMVIMCPWSWHVTSVSISADISDQHMVDISVIRSVQPGCVSSTFTLSPVK